VVLPIGKAVARARRHIEAGVDEENRTKVQILSADELPRTLSALEAEAAGTEGRVRGYRVKVAYKAVAEGENQDRRRRISDVILRSLRRFKAGEAESRDRK
jgi:hypothetical protein